jgi:hypothetical protein
MGLHAGLGSLRPVPLHATELPSCISPPDMRYPTTHPIPFSTRPPTHTSPPPSPHSLPHLLHLSPHHSTEHPQPVKTIPFLLL